MANIGKKQIATYNNKVVHIVPEYNRHKPENIDGKITITKTSVTSGIYAKYSGNEQTEGMYILAHTINDGNYRTGEWTDYKENQLVAKDDLNYRFLLPTGEDNTSPTYNALLASCVDSSNTARTINRDDGHNTYRTELTPKDGYSKVPAGCIEKQKEDGTWDSVYSWDTPLDRVRITIENVDGNLRFVFDTDCVYELTVYTVIDDNIDPEKTEKIDKVCHTRITLADFVEEITGATFIGVKDVNGDSITDEDTEDFCGNTSIYVNYTTNEYTVTNEIDSNCATVEISNPTPEYGDTVDITITKTLDKANIGAGSISMEGASNPIHSWNKTVGPISYRIDSVIGNITINAGCGDPANHPVRLEWYNDEEPESDPAIRSINVPHGNIIHPNDFNCTSTFTLPTGYEIKRSIPDMDSEITITDDNTVIQYHYGLKEYKVTYEGDETVTINVSESGKVKHGKEITTQGVYTIESGYQNANAIIASGTATGVSANNGSVTVTGVTSNVTVRISANPIPTHLYCVRFSIDQAGTFGSDPDKTSRYCLIIQEGTCHEDIPYSLNSGYEINGEIPSQITINTDNTIDVCNITEDVNLVIPVRLVTHTVKYCLTDGTGMSLIGAQAQCITKTVVHGLNSTQGFSLTSGYNSVIIDSITPQDKLYEIDYDNNTININNITKNVEIWMHADAIPNQNVTFKLFIDGVEQPNRETTKSVAYGSTATHSFRSLGIVIDRTDVNVTADVTGVTTDYDVLSDAAIGVSGTPITEATVITTYLKTVQQREVLSIEITSSNMDAMGGVVFNGKINYSEGEPDIITDQEEFNLKFEIRDSNNNPYNVDIVNVHDYDFEVGTLNSQQYTGGEKPEILKTKIEGLEYAIEDNLSRLDRHSYNPSSKLVKIVHNNSGKEVEINIDQRAEKYGYYTNIDSTTPTSELSNTNWNLNSLVDYGDAYSMYGKESEGLDVYNKDITPYYITGTYIGENPLLHLDNNKTFVQGSSYIQQPKDYNKINDHSNGHNEHYHTTWYEGSGISINDSDKGKIFTEDSISISSEFCGGDETPECGCYEYTTKGTSTLEAIKSTNEGIAQPVLYTYNCSYIKPIHKYGIDSISYYHLLNNDYRSKIIDTLDNPNPFKDINGNLIEFSYPVHIYIKEEEDTTSKNTSGLLNINSLGSGWSAYPLNTIRWAKSDDSPHYTLTPNDSYYDTYDYSNNPIYYDYANKIKPGTDSESDILIFDMYNNPYYIYDEYNEKVGETNSNNVIVGEEPTDTVNNLKGRSIQLYYTLMSPETLIRPIHVNNQTKFAVLTSEHNGTKYGDYSESGNCVELPLDEYINNSLGRTRYVSEVFYDTTKIKEEPITTADDPELGIDLDKYPYTISGINTDYLHKYVPATEGASEEYVELNERDSDGALQYKAYNLVADISFKQYYNNTFNRTARNNYYAHNPDNAKYVMCTDSFDNAYYDYYNGDEISGIEDWKRILAEGIQSIDYNYSDNRWHIVTNSGEYKASYQSTTSLSYYYNQILELSPIYTNAPKVTISFNSCKDTCGLGRWKIVTIDHDDGSSSETELPVSYGSVEIPNTSKHNLEIKITVGTSEQEYNPNYDCIEYPGNIPEYTGGGQINIACEWNELGVPGGIQTRTILANIGGTCNKPEHPNTSGTYLTWDELKQYYRDDVNGCTVFTNKGKHLVPKTAND